MLARDRPILVTGATDGLGRAVAAELAAGGATVLVHGRNRERGEATVAELRERAGHDRVELVLGDFASLASVRELADAVLARRQPLDVLVNNAGIGSTLPGGGARLESDDGHELRFAVNYLAPFLLTKLLADSVVGRIVNVSSAGQMPIDFDDVMLTRGYDGTRAYCQSKLAQVMHTFDLAGGLAGRHVAVNCLHPATYMPTKIVRDAGREPASSLQDGADATLALIRDPEHGTITGRYFNGRREERAHPQAYDRNARRRLRELSEQLVAAFVG
jgi:NAD(P)-dependent dehydrogenase (short-subunit alcohol dehydrogenase family)